MAAGDVAGAVTAEGGLVNGVSVCCNVLLFVCFSLLEIPSFYGLVG